MNYVTQVEIIGGENDNSNDQTRKKWLFFSAVWVILSLNQWDLPKMMTDTKNGGCYLILCPVYSVELINYFLKLFWSSIFSFLIFFSFIPFFCNGLLWRMESINTLVIVTKREDNIYGYCFFELIISFFLDGVETLARNIPCIARPAKNLNDSIFR